MSTKNRYQPGFRKSLPLPPLSSNPNQIEELYAQHSIGSSRGMTSFDNEEDPLITENKKLEAKINKLTEENQKINEQNQNYVIQNDSLVKKNKNLEVKIKDQEIKMRSLIEKNEQMNKELLNLNIKLSKMPPNAEKAQKENELLKKQIDELRLDIKRKESQISESRLCLQSKTNQIHETSREKINITDKFKNIRAQNKDLESKLNLMKSENEKLLINERNHESALNNIKAEKDQIISELKDKLEKFKTKSDQSNQETMFGIEETPKNIEERNWRRKEKKDKANQLFENFKKMKLHEKELTDKINEIQSEIVIEENTLKLEMSINPTRSLKPKSEKNVEDASKEDITPNSSTSQDSKATELAKSNSENSETIENSEDRDNELESNLNKLKQDRDEVQNELSEFIQKEEKLKDEMVKFGIKPSSFEKVDEEWTEEEDESDFTFKEIRERVKKLRSAKNEAFEQMKLFKCENETLKIDLVDKQTRIDKITEVVKSLVSQRIIKPAPPK